MPIDLKKITDSLSEINHLCAMLNGHITRSYPPAGCPGSQFDEDVVLNKLLPQSNGVYVDIGASHPVECSNTHALYNRGWRGLLIEPLFWNWPALLRHRRGDFLVESAVRNYTGQTVLRVQGSVSSVLPSWNIQEIAEIIVDCERGVEILDQFPSIRDACAFCNIDVEGAEQEVITSIDWATFRPKVVCVEFRVYAPDAPGRDLSPQWQPALEAFGYKEVHKSQINKIFQRS
jgi:FkbM family methyltransferase